jgi:hypothetical protein
MATREGSTHATDHGDATNLGSDQHGKLLREKRA